MQLTGHKTRTIFQRSNIVSEGDLRIAEEKLERDGTTLDIECGIGGHVLSLAAEGFRTSAIASSPETHFLGW